MRDVTLSQRLRLSGFDVLLHVLAIAILSLPLTLGLVCLWLVSR